MKLIFKLYFFIFIPFLVTGCGGSNNDIEELSTLTYFVSKKTVFTPDPEDNSNDKIEFYEYDERNRQIGYVNNSNNHNTFSRSIFDNNNIIIKMSGKATPVTDSPGYSEVNTYIDVFNYTTDNRIKSVRYLKRQDFYGSTETITSFPDFFEKTLSDRFANLLEPSYDGFLMFEAEVFFIYDELNRLISKRKGGVNGETIATYLYDEYGNLTAEKNIYDPFSRIGGEIDTYYFWVKVGPDSNEDASPPKFYLRKKESNRYSFYSNFAYEYDEKNRLIYSYYDDDLSSDFNQIILRRVYDGNDKLMIQTEGVFSSGAGFVYNFFNLTKTKFFYSDEGEIIKQEHYDGAASTTPPNAFLNENDFSIFISYPDIRNGGLENILSNYPPPDARLGDLIGTTNFSRTFDSNNKLLKLEKTYSGVPKLYFSSFLDKSETTTYLYDSNDNLISEIVTQEGVDKSKTIYTWRKLQ